MPPASHPPAPASAPRPRPAAPPGEQGSAAAEITLLTPLLMIVLLFMVLLGRITEAQAVITDAAHQAARAASIAASPATAAASARQAAATSLSGRGLACQHFTITIALGGFSPGTAVRATVTCTASLSGLSLLRIPGSRTFTATFASVIDAHRSQSPGFVPAPGAGP